MKRKLLIIGVMLVLIIGNIYLHISTPINKIGLLNQSVNVDSLRIPIGTPVYMIKEKRQFLKKVILVRFTHNHKEYEETIEKDKLTEYVYDENFEDEIRNFPHSYQDSLRYLHTLYPTWVFHKIDSSLDFEKASTIYQTKSLIDSSDPNLIESTRIKEGKKWRKASLDLVRYAFDPRNSLGASYALTFEKLTYNEEETLDTAKSLLENTDMEGIEELSQKSWAELFYKGAKRYNISLYNVIARAKQESNSTSLGYKGGKRKGKLYYNIFNIGANKGAEMGIDYAYEHNWDTREKAINGGIKYLSERYIESGQDSLYLQRFDIIRKTINKHIYMTNILAHQSEGYQLLRGYTNLGLENETRHLYIPVYKNMPEEACPYPSNSDSRNYTLE